MLMTGLAVRYLELMQKTKPKEKEMKKAMRGMGRTFLRGRVYWISYLPQRARGPRKFEVGERSGGVKLLKQRFGEIQTGQFVADEKKFTFDKLVEGIMTDYKLNGHRS